MHTQDLANNFTLTTNYKYKGKHLDVHNVTYESGISMPETHQADDIPDLSIIQYNKSIGEWEAVSNNEFVDSIIDGGEADSDAEYVAAFDIDGGFA